jgi:hypothetical protein
MAMVKNEQVANDSQQSKLRQPRQLKATLSELKGNSDVWYKIHVLIYDLCNIKNDRSSQSRIEHTVDELYISEPYFTTAEAALIKATVVEVTKSTENIIDNEVTLNEEVHSATEDFNAVEEAIKGRLSNFYNKRKASGDFRPCGPHDMVPVYLSVFGIPRSELVDKRFLGRLRRSGLDESREQHEEAGNANKKKKGKNIR